MDGTALMRPAGAFALLAALALGALPAGSGVAGVNGKIAYERHHPPAGGHQSRVEIWTMNQDGSGQRLLGPGKHPDWSPDGTQVAFVRSGDLIVTGADGGGERIVPISPEPIWPEEPDWSPDGTQIAFSANDSLYIIEAAGGTARQLLSDRADGVAPTWSPDGAKIAFLARGAVWVINADGSGLRALPGGRARFHREESRGVAWSPDGSTIAYGDSGGGISTIRLDGAEPVEVLPYLGGGAADDPSWSPDGSRIAFDHDWDVCVVNADGSGLGRLTYAPVALVEGTHLHVNRGPAWQPLPEASAPGGPPASQPGPPETWNRNHAWGFACARQLAGRTLTTSTTPTRVRVDGIVIYRIRVENRGPVPIGELLRFSASLDGGLRILSVATSQGRCGWSGQWDRGTPEHLVSCSLGALFPGERATITVRARAKTPGELVLRASFDQPLDEEDPDEVVIVVPPPTDPSEPDLLHRTRVLGCTRLGTQNADRLVGSPHADVLCGLDGDDDLRPGGARDLVAAGPGDDHVDSRDRRFDVVICGSGIDSVVADRLDRVGRQCERVSRG